MGLFYRCKWCGNVISDQSLLIDERDDLVIERCTYCNEHIKEYKKRTGYSIEELKKELKEKDERTAELEKENAELKEQLSKK
jgi:cell shape-determining protein MreC